MNKIKIALVFENIETAKSFVAINAPNGMVRIDSANEFVYETPILRFNWIKPFTNCKDKRVNFVFTTEDIRDTKWFARRGCPVFANQRCVEGYNDITTTDPWMIPYFQGGYDETKQYMSMSGKTIYLV